MIIDNSTAAALGIDTLLLVFDTNAFIRIAMSLPVIASVLIFPSIILGIILKRARPTFVRIIVTLQLIVIAYAVFRILTGPSVYAGSAAAYYHSLLISLFITVISTALLSIGAGLTLYFLDSKVWFEKWIIGFSVIVLSGMNYFLK